MTDIQKEGLRLEEIATDSGYRIGCVTLAMPATLNALTLATVDAIAAQLDGWHQDDAIVAVCLKSAVNKAFCAGGDIQRLYQAITKNHATGTLTDSYAENFFAHEYRLDYQLHTYSKPVLCWGHGVLMGGGLGLFRASSHRVVTDNTRAAMPEITIGLFPDAGGTLLLKEVPGRLGLFLGLTGVAVNGTDAVGLGIGTHFIRHDLLSDVMATLATAHWQGSALEDRLLMNTLLDGFAQLSELARPPPALLERADIINNVLISSHSYADIIEQVLTLESQDEWFAKAIATLRSGCPVTAGIIVEQLSRAPALDLAECFQMEMIIGTQCARHLDFAEGVRALLIDKDRNPVWQYPDLHELPQAIITEHFTPPWAENPLADLSGSHNQGAAS